MFELLGARSSQFKTMARFGVEGFVGGKIAHRTPEIQYFFQIHVVVFLLLCIVVVNKQS